MSEADGWIFSQRDHVRFADLDARGHLNNVALLVFFEAARIAYLRERFPQIDPTDPGPTDIILASQSIDYRAPAGLQDELRTRIRPGEVRRSSFRLDFEVLRVPEETLVAEGHGIYVGFNYDRSCAQPLAPVLAERLREDGGGDA